MTVLDASAVAALLFEEPGGGRVASAIAVGDTLMSAVNFAEVATLLSRRKVKNTIHILEDLEHQVNVVPFTTEQAYLVGVLVHVTNDLRLSLGDRACLVLGQETGQPVMTADKAWSRLSTGVGVDVTVIR